MPSSVVILLVGTVQLSFALSSLCVYVSTFHFGRLHIYIHLLLLLLPAPVEPDESARSIHTRRLLFSSTAAAESDNVI